MGLRQSAEQEWPFPEEPCEPHFDPEFSGWIVSRYADVVSVLTDSRFVPATPRSAIAMDIRQHGSYAQAANAIMPKIAAVLPVFVGRATRALCQDGHCEIVAEVLRPLCFELAAAVMDVPARPELQAHADVMYRAATYPYDNSLREDAGAAAAELSRPLGSPFAVQSFTALTTSLASLLAASWATLLQHPDCLSRLNVGGMLEECLRLCGPAAIQFRRASTEMTLAGQSINRNDLLLLLLQTANRDPSIFMNPLNFDAARFPNPHLAFGRGAHPCVGAQMVRTIARELTSAVMPVLLGLRLADPPVYHGFAIRFLPELRLARAAL